jgi:hypothetical protein
MLAIPKKFTLRVDRDADKTDVKEWRLPFMLYEIGQVMQHVDGEPSSLSTIEGCCEFLDVEILADPLAVASLEAREVAAVVPLKAKISQKIRRLQTGRRIRAWVYMQTIPLIVLAPL